MNVGQLKEILSYYDDDLAVNFASQPNYPLAYELGDEYAVSDGCAFYEDEDDEGNTVSMCEEHGEEEPCGQGEPALWLAEGYQIGYLPAGVAGELQWR